MIKVNNISNWAMPPEAFNWIYENIPEGSTILELGSGFGSIALGLNYKVYSLEQNKEWCGLSNKVNYIYAPIEDGFYHNDALINLPKYDLLIIDGPTKASGGRKGFLQNLDYFNTDCPILLDDLHREDEMFIMEKLAIILDRKYEVFESENKKFGII
jgi:hypothetical protein